MNSIILLYIVCILQSVQDTAEFLSIRFIYPSTVLVTSGGLVSQNLVIEYICTLSTFPLKKNYFGSYEVILCRYISFLLETNMIPTASEE